MGRRRARWADIPAGQDNPVDAAVTARDRSAREMVEAAVAHGEVMLAFQPVVTAGPEGRVAFHEGLIRILDETGRIIPAREFIDTVESSETGRVIDCLALEKGLRTLADHPDLRLSVNMSARSIGYRRWMRVLRRGIEADPTVPERLILEITEGSAMLVPELVTGFMAELQSRGVAFALDDFGAGHTSLRHLRDFYFDILKIDGQFIRGIAGNPDNQVLTGALMAIARQFDMLCVAESVERAADAAYLAQAGIDGMQGYYFAAPTVRPDWMQSPERRASA